CAELFAGSVTSRDGRYAGMAELADATDLKSVTRKGVWVRLPLPALVIPATYGEVVARDRAACPRTCPRNAPPAHTPEAVPSRRSRRRPRGVHVEHRSTLRLGPHGFAGCLERENRRAAEAGARRRRGFWSQRLRPPSKEA